MGRNGARVSLITLGLFICLALGTGCMTGGDGMGAFRQSEGQVVSPQDNQPVPGYSSGVVPWDPTAGLVAIGQVPQPELGGGDKAVMSANLIPFVTPEGLEGTRGTSALADSGSYYYAENVSPSIVQGTTFAPLGGAPAYACFELCVTPDTLNTVGFAWYSLPEDFGGYYVGIGDRAAQTWHWYQGPGDGVLTFDPRTWISRPNSAETMLVCVVLESGQPADFWQLKVGVDEVRGTGLEWEDPATTPKLAQQAGKSVSTLDIPRSVDLRTWLPPISDQGQMGSCTAFATTDSAFNILINQFYQQYGWDVTTNANRLSPMYSYVKSGVAPIGNWNPVCGASVGRYMGQAFNVLIQIGTATQATVPYQATENCSTTFPAKAAEEAALIKLDSYYLPGSQYYDTRSIVDCIREELSWGKPVVIAMYGLEYSFLYYTGGVYHYGGTAGVSGGHAMCIVGYDDDQQAFLVRNSWGAGWGLGGYWWCGYDAVSDLAVEMRMSSYAISASYNQDTKVYFCGEGEPDPDPNPDPDPVGDEVEPNNSTAQANTLPAFNFSGFSGTVTPSADAADYFKFTYQNGSSTTFTLTHASGATIDMQLVTAAGQVIASGTPTDNGDTLTGTWQASGSAYVKVLVPGGFGSITGGMGYTLSGDCGNLPATPGGVHASQGTLADRVEVTWNASPGAMGYYVERATAEGGPFSQLGFASSSPYADSTAAGWTPYWYRVSAYNAEGYSGASTAVAGYRPGPAPTGIAASDNLHPDRVIVSWSPVEGATDYQIKRGPSLSGPFTVLATVQSGPFDDTTIMPGAVYYYTVSARKNELAGANGTADSGSAGTINPSQRPALPTEPETVPVQPGGPGTGGGQNLEPGRVGDDGIHTQAGQ